MSLVLYRTPERWRFAVFFVGGGVVDGALSDDVAPDCEPAVAQAAMEQTATNLLHRTLEVTWHPSDQADGWTGEVTAASPLPPA